jgi:hypothetical protein
MREFSTKSGIEFEPQPNQDAYLQDMPLRSVFLRNGAVCMRVQNCHDLPNTDKLWVINLQTARIWVAHGLDLVQPIRVKAKVSYL